MKQTNRRFVIISPCRDESEFMRQTLDSVAQQEFVPTLWLIVDDGSTDETPQILSEYQQKYDFIKVVKRQNRGQRSVGPGVVEAFYEGLDTINLDDYDYLCKLDLDLELPDRYFEILVERMESDPRLGSCSGKPYIRLDNNELKSERCGDEMSVGMTKFYRTTCFQQIGGFVREVMWDAIDCHLSRMQGWKVVSWDEPALRFIHLRPMGSSQKGILTGRQRHGFGQYFMGTGLVYMTATAIYRMAYPPYLLGGLSMLYGYLKSMVTRQRQYGSREFRDYLNRYQWRCLIVGKKKATIEFESQQASQWNPPVSER